MRAAFLALALASAVASAADVPRDALRHRQELTREARQAWGLTAPVATFAAQIHQESGWNPGAVSPKGATGLAQLMPGTADYLKVDPADPIENLDGGARYLLEQMAAFGSLELALAAYNAGPEAVRKYDGVPPYAETQSHIVKVMAVYDRILTEL